MLYAFGFDRVGVLLSDLYFVNPTPAEGQEGPERGVRVEVRALERGALKGSIYSAQPIAVGQPIWRADLLESADGEPSSFDRTHYHPAFTGWEPGNRVFARALSADPLGWLGRRLSDLPGLLKEAQVPADTADPSDAASLRDAVPEILDATERLLAGVRAGHFAAAPAGGPAGGARVGWL